MDLEKNIWASTRKVGRDGQGFKSKLRIGLRPAIGLLYVLHDVYHATRSKMRWYKCRYFTASLSGTLGIPVYLTIVQ